MTLTSSCGRYHATTKAPLGRTANFAPRAPVSCSDRVLGASSHDVPSNTFASIAPRAGRRQTATAVPVSLTRTSASAVLAAGADNTTGAPHSSETGSNLAPSTTQVSRASHGAGSVGSFSTARSHTATATPLELDETAGSVVAPSVDRRSGEDHTS